MFSCKTGPLCRELVVEAEVSLGQVLKGRYTYIGETEGRPRYQSQDHPARCVFWNAWWKLENCDHPDPAGSIGFIGAAPAGVSTTQTYPQVTSPTTLLSCLSRHSPACRMWGLSGATTPAGTPLDSCRRTRGSA